MADPISDFVGAIKARGIFPIEPIADKLASGNLVRFRAEGDKPGRRNGWAQLHLDGVPAGAFGHAKVRSSCKIPQKFERIGARYFCQRFCSDG